MLGILSGPGAERFLRVFRTERTSASSVVTSLSDWLVREGKIGMNLLSVTKVLEKNALNASALSMSFWNKFVPSVIVGSSSFLLSFLRTNLKKSESL